jgi:hypothetical protein
MDPKVYLKYLSVSHSAYVFERDSSRGTRQINGVSQ